MTSGAKTQCVFLKVQHARQKLQRLCSVVQQHVTKGRRVLISVDSLEVAEFVDRCLWQTLPESFIPHEICQDALDTPVAIAVNPQTNLNKASVLFHLAEEISPLFNKVPLLYEFLDNSSAIKQQRSLAHLHYYQQQQAEIIER